MRVLFIHILFFTILTSVKLSLMPPESLFLVQVLPLRLLSYTTGWCFCTFSISTKSFLRRGDQNWTPDVASPSIDTKAL